jgi:glycosyltransferase involved in cell wall biosynthesis
MIYHIKNIIIHMPLGGKNSSEFILLSILIPTKNRQSTAIAAIESAVNLKSNNIEIIVQDCSDDNSLAELLNERWGNNKKIKYFHTETKPSLTENWDHAINNAEGVYVIGIGDDDAVLSKCIEVVTWMFENNIDATLGPFITYIWPDAYTGSSSNSKITYSTNYTGKIAQIDLQYEFNKKALNCGFGYTEGLPNIYHGIVKKVYFNKHKSKCGYFLASTSFDVYNAFILAKYINNFFYIDYPLTIRGISGKSNANRIVSNTFHKHFEEFNNLDFPKFLPKIYNSETTIAESTIKALLDTENHALIEKLDYAIVYAKCASLSISKLYFHINNYFQLPIISIKKVKFIKLFFVFSYENLKQKFINVLFKFIYKFNIYFYNKILGIKSKKKLFANNIITAVTLIESDLSTNQIYIDYNKIEQIIYSKNEIWD